MKILTSESDQTARCRFVGELLETESIDQADTRELHLLPGFLTWLTASHPESTLTQRGNKPVCACEANLVCSEGPCRRTARK